ncbi:MAG TPA: hypothetical protein VKX49_12815 [Bryobacteraceae bacterium]|nr:hypothetical protein [Bryobacteraceae bacterium]
MSTRTCTHTFAILTVSREAFAEIWAKLAAANYEHCLHKEGSDEESVANKKHPG